MNKSQRDAIRSTCNGVGWSAGVGGIIAIVECTIPFPTTTADALLLIGGAILISFALIASGVARYFSLGDKP